MKTLPLGCCLLALLASSAFGEAIAPSLKGDLVALNGKRVGRFDDAPLANAKYFGVYFSAEWCGPCKAFTPKLVSWYNEFKPKHPEFELLFVSNDHDEASMENYMATDKMPWPAVKFSKLRNAKSLTKLGGSGIPCLVLIDADGKVLSHSYEGKTYVGPNKVLADITKTLGGGSTPAAAPASTSGTGTSALGTSSGLGGGTSLGTGSRPAATPRGSGFDDFFKKKQ
jgi:nucleoredoxin